MSVTVDLTEFNKKMLEYKEQTNLTLEVACNRCLKNLLIHAAENGVAEVANKTEIDNLKNAPWFNLKITQILGKKFSTGKRRKISGSTKGWTGSHSVSDYRKKWNDTAKRFVASRLRGVGFVQRILKSAANTIKAKDAKNANFSIKVKGAFARFVSATIWKPTAEITFGYHYSGKRKINGQGAERSFLRCVNKAIPPTVADMQVYILRKLKEAYKK